MRTTPILLLTVAIELFSLRRASAQQVVYVPGPRPRQITDVRGFEAMADVGIGGHVNDSSAAFTTAPNPGDHLFWPGLGVQGTFGYRFIHWMSIGAHVAYQNQGVRDLPVGTTDGWANTFATGGYLRWYGGAAAHLGRFDPWISVGCDPFASVWVGHATPLGDVHQRIDTVAVPVSLGLDVAVSRHIALDIMGQVSPWIPYRFCSGAPGGTSLLCTSQNITANTYLFVGVGGRFTLGR